MPDFFLALYSVFVMLRERTGVFFTDFALLGDFLWTAVKGAHHGQEERRSTLGGGCCQVGINVSFFYRFLLASE